MLEIPHSSLKRIVIIGGGFGGIELAKRLDKSKYQVIMIDKNNYHTFQPLLYQVATGGLEPDSIAYPIRKIFSGRKNFIFRMGEALEIKSDDHILITSLGEIKYDYLVLATGSITNYFNKTDIEQNSMPLKSVTDALNLRSKILQNFEKLLTETDAVSRYFNIVIVGGGPTGVEVAGAFAELKKHGLPGDYPELNIKKLQVHLIEAANSLLVAMSRKSSEKSYKFLSRMGVKIWLNTSVDSYRDEKVYLNTGDIIECNTLVWTAGVRGNSIKGLPESVTVKGSRLKTDMYNRLVGINDVFVIGDLAAMSTSADSIFHPMLAPVAIQQAKNLANNMNIRGNSTWRQFKYRDLGTMATIGRNKAVADFGKLHLQGIIAWLVWTFVHLMSIVGFRNRIIVFINWLWNYISYDHAIRLIIRPYYKKKEGQ